VGAVAMKQICKSQFELYKRVKESFLVSLKRKLIEEIKFFGPVLMKEIKEKIQ